MIARFVFKAYCTSSYNIFFQPYFVHVILSYLYVFWFYQIAVCKIRKNHNIVIIDE